ncbi:MAG: glycosyltransferase [Lachnospiraceae bacterium]|nr:glycosyltransferase [Lachnospiraceae bacterium]
MRILVNDIAASKTGALSILTDFYEYVKLYDKENEWIFLIGGPFIEETDRIKVIIMERVKSSQKNRLKFDLIQGSRFIKKYQPDVVFSLQNTLTRGNIYNSNGDKIPEILYVHQPLGFQKWKKFSFFKSEEREYAIYQYLIGAMIDASVKKADRVIVQTAWMKEAVIRKTLIAPDKIENILPNIPDLSSYKKEGEHNPKQFFFPSGEILYKNHECILKASRLLNQRGITDYKVFFTLKSLEDVTKRVYEDNHDNIHWMGRISREEVFSFYNTSTLIFPSYIETFGVPLAEARQMNTLILASDCPFCHEVLDGYENAYFFNPFKEQELSQLMEHVISGKLTFKPSKTIETTQSNSYGRILELLTKER